MKKSELTIALIVGGASLERAISKLSSAGIYKALKSLGYKVKLIDPAYGKTQPKQVEDFFSTNDFYFVSEKNYIEAFDSEHFVGVDLVFLGLHGKWGEDGTIQSLLELKGLKYTGSGVLASSLSMDKGLAKIHFRDKGISVPDGFVVNKNYFELENVLSRIKKSFTFPLVIKPNDQGSTFGLTICKSENEIEQALNLSFSLSPKALIEEFIPGREMTVGILDQQALPVLEIIPKHELYDYECKYTKGMSQYIVPANIPTEVFNEMQQQALTAYECLECSSYARVDFRLKDDNTFYCLELNTLPGLTETSLIPKMANAIGISFEDLIDRIVKLSLK